MQQRNPLIAELLYKSKDSEAYSSGIQRIYNECNENDVKVDFRKEPYGFTVIFYRKSFNEKDENSIINSTLNIKNKYPELQEIYIDVLELIIKDKYITQYAIALKLNKTRNAIARNIKTLKEKGILERIGSKKDGYWKVNL